ncbi:VOC family protein [Paeniglutamicibacter sp. ORCA_105]|uniref:VOC family protein n=1 Tax=Paeniglutamicibacter sp. ORCA_105 TaxID=3377336 RepID=UPI00389606AE
MYLENIVFDAVDPQRLGTFWQDLLGAELLTDSPEGFETRLSIPGGPDLDLCFQPVPDPPADPVRLHLDVLGGPARDAVVAQALRLGARHLDIGQGNVPWVVLGDPEGNAFCVMDDRAAHRDTGAIAAIPIDSADPERDARFWAWLTGWTDAGAAAPRTLRHPSLRGPLLEFCEEPAPKSEMKNRMHLDVRLESADDPDEVAAGIGARGGRELRPDWGDIPWRVYQDPSGNEFCVLPAP